MPSYFPLFRPARADHVVRIGWGAEPVIAPATSTGASWNPGFNLPADTGLVDIGGGDAMPDGAADDDGPRGDTGCRQ